MVLVIYVASKTLNRFMKAADLCPDHKVFTHPFKVDISVPRIPLVEYLDRLLAVPHDDPEDWIAAVSTAGTIRVVKGIRELSDGQRILFVGVNQ